VVRGGQISLASADLRNAGVAMLGLGLTLPLLPGNPGLPCALRTLTGVPCPLCGMSTSVEATVRLDLDAALAANPAGIAAVAIAVLLALWRPRRLDLPAPLLFAALGAMWLFELHRFGFL
jgi:uncharacterized protein DUF2752